MAMNGRAGGLFLALTAAMAGIAHQEAAAAGIPPVDPDKIVSRYATLAGSDALSTDADPSKAKPSECQPRKGEAVLIEEEKKDLDATHRLNPVRITVLEGNCAGRSGWVDAARLQKMRAARQ